MLAADRPRSLRRGPTSASRSQATLSCVQRTTRAPGLAAAASGLRSPRSGLLGQGLRFAISGGLVSLVYLGTTTLLADVAGLPFQVALPIGFSAGLVVHFTLQRFFVWIHHEEFALPLHHQVGRYLVAAAVQYGVTAASTAVLPGVLGIPTEIVYLATVAGIVATNFVVFRFAIFHAKPSEPDGARAGG